MNVLPPMRPALPILAAAIALLAACSSQQDTALETVKAAHTVTAEWAMVERLGDEKRVTQTYRSEMRDKAREALQAERRSMSDAAAPAVRTLHALQRDPAPTAATLAAAAQRLDQAEKQLEAR
jgi:multidrug resistance efflux pump